MKSRHFFFVMLFLSLNSLGISQSLYNNGHIPQNCQQEWTKAGLYKDVNAYQKFDVTQQVGATLRDKVITAINRARAASPGGLSIVYFPEGDYVFTNQLSNPFHLSYPDSNIIFQGDGSDKTFLHFYTYACSNNWNSFQFSGSAGDYKVLDQNISKDNTSIHGDLSGVTGGDWIHFTEYNYDYDPPDDRLELGVVGQVTKLTNKNGAVGTIKDMATKDYSTSNDLYIRKIFPVTNIGIENLTIARYPCGEATDEYYNIYFSFAVNCWVRGVECNNTARHHLNASYCSHLEISGCYFHDAPSYGGGGHGYGLTLYASTTNTLVENNIFRHLRHAMVSGGGANCNVWTYNYSREQVCEGLPPTYRDIDLHAKYPYASLYEQNWVVTIGADDAFGNNGPYNAFVRNYCYDDENDEWGYIHLLNAPNSSVLGCEVSSPTGGVGGGGNTSFSIEKYGKFSDGSITDYDLMVWKTHYEVYLNPVFRAGSYLLDLSYYYSSIPKFVEDAGLSFPSLGPNWYWHSQNIPARLRYFGGGLKTYNAYPTTTITTSGTLAHNETWRGIVNLTDNVTVPSGITLTIQPGTTVKFPSGKKIIVNGTLKAEGTASQKITFTRSGTSGTWYGICFGNSSVDANCIVKYCDIQYASYGIYPNHANPKIENNTFSNNTYALYLYYSSPSIKSNAITNDLVYATHSSAYMENNLIDNSNACNYGLYLYNSSPDLFNNTIRGDMADYAAKAYYYSQPQLGTQSDNSTDGYNRIEYDGNGFTLIAENHAWPFLGSTQICPYQGERNTVKGEYPLTLVTATNYSTVDAEYVWWGEYPPNIDMFSADGTSSIDKDPARSSDPGGGSSLGKALADTFKESLTNAHDSQCPAPCDSLWELAEKYRKAGKNDSAITIYEMIVDQFSYTAKAHYSLVRINSLTPTTDTAELNNYLVGLTSDQKMDMELQAASQELLVSSYHKSGDLKNAIQTAEQLLQQFPKTEHEYTALFNLFNIYQKDLNDDAKAKEILETLKSKYPDYELTLIAQFDMGEPVDWKLSKRFESKPPVPVMTEEMPTTFSLGVNYPNPFNPSTTIPFALPEDSHVKLTIYDILGREVVTLMDARVPAGFGQAVWNGRDRYGSPVASGVYIYRLDAADPDNIRANRFNESRKLLLLK